MKSELAQLKALYTPSHYKVLRLNAEVNELENTIAARRNTVISRIQSQFDTALRLEQLLAHDYMQQTHTIQAQMEKTTRYGILKREFEMTQQLYESMLQKVKEAAVASALRTTNIRVIDPARLPVEPYSPKLTLNCAIGFVGSILFGVALVIVKEQRDSSFRHSGDSRTLLNLRELGVIPAASVPPLRRRRLRLLAGEPDRFSLDLATWQHGPDLMAESFRGTTASILFYTSSAEALRSYVFTSAHAMEGKTTVLSNVGIALVETRRRVLLIDADLRRPRLHEIFDVPNDRGLTDLLQEPTQPVDKRSLAGFVHHTQVTGLDVLPSGPGVARIANVLHSSCLRALLARFRQEYDAVLIDTPPVKEFSDARILGRIADSVILVVRAGRTPLEDVRATWWQFLEDQTPVHGVILNALEAHRDASKYAYYPSDRNAANG
jgi:capsular exopolysaccharide synthesis family protein